MKQMTSFELSFKQDGKTRNMPVQVYYDSDNTVVVFDCRCCPDAISNRLPGGVMIPIVSTLRKFFAERKMKNVSVQMTGREMWRTYQGHLSEDDIAKMNSTISDNITKFLKKKRKSI